MSNSRQRNISEDSEHPQLQFQARKDSVSLQESEKPNILDQGFILYSDDEIRSNSQSFTDQEQISELSNLSRQSSCSSIANFDVNGQPLQSSFLKSLSQDNQESSVYNIQESQCSQSQIQLLHALEPLLKGKVLLRRSPRIAVYGAKSINESQSEDKTNILSAKNDQLEMDKKAIESEMVEDDKPTSSQNISSQRIIEQKYEAPTSIFTNNLSENDQNIHSNKQQIQNPFLRFTRSSKKNIPEESQLSFANIQKSTSMGLFNNNGTQLMNDSEYLSRVTKDFVMINRKQKRIKKQQQKQAHTQFTIKSFKKRTNSFQRPSN